ELRRWLDLWEEQQQIIRANIDMIRDLEELLGERAQLRDELLSAEQTLASALRDRDSFRERLEAADALAAETARRLEHLSGLEARQEDSFVVAPCERRLGLADLRTVVTVPST